MAVIDYSQKDDHEVRSIEESDIRCAMGCGRKPNIVWMMKGPLYLCAEDAQYLATHLLKDVRDYERQEGFSIKVRTEKVLAPHMTMRTPPTIDDVANDNSDDIPR